MLGEDSACVFPTILPHLSTSSKYPKLLDVGPPLTTKCCRSGSLGFWGPVNFCAPQAAAPQAESLEQSFESVRLEQGALSKASSPCASSTALHRRLDDVPLEPRASGKAPKPCVSGRAP